MEAAKFNYNANERIKSLKPEVLAIGIGAATVLALTYLLRRRNGIPPDPPPIIIKSGSFVIDSVYDLSHTSGNPNTYQAANFGEIQGVRVFRTNEIDGTADSDDFEDADGVEVDIRLQKYTPSGKWVNIEPLVTIGTADNFAGAKDFVMKIGKKLKKKPRPKPGRKEHWVDDETDDIRFGEIIVREYDGGGKNYTAIDGDDFIIAFYNTLD